MSFPSLMCMDADKRPSVLNVLLVSIIKSCVVAQFVSAVFEDTYCTCAVGSDGCVDMSLCTSCYVCIVQYLSG